ncbi:hypothetical protein F3Y22_tig00111095pilonHSYRG00654 [Hibiscus syriacus]|uniref:HAT C-terminal dimerisation domain-containing protein n=1 Tax=Hibiscus syriacus TaxID=106335 RepID=A0A6A2Z2L3_HIBSY|nr:hypothetical protein F3Y22_tig00111095pilonHSYRG00654 [Hibiscus syriacus]
MKSPSMYELRVPLLKQEVKEVEEQVNEHKKEWADKGCSILSDRWRDSVVQKDIVNFMVNSPKGSIFVKSMDVSDVSNDANLLFGILDKMVDEVGEENVVEVITDNASAYVKASMDKAKESIARSFPNQEDPYKKTFDIIDHRWEHQLHRPLHAAGHYLNPSIFYDDVKQIESCEEIKDDLQSCIERLSPNAQVEDQSIRELNKYKKAKGMFGKSSAIRQRKQMALAEWWETYGASAPNLQKFVIRVLSLTCSATSCERNLGIFQHLHTKKCNRLAQERLNDMVYVKFNHSLQRRKRTPDLIALDDIDENAVGRASGANEPSHFTRGSRRGGDDGVDPSRNDKGKRLVLVDEEEMEEDIGVTDDDEGDGDVLGFDDGGSWRHLVCD